MAGFRHFSVDLSGDLTISCSHCNSLSGDPVKQAKTLTDQELEAVLHHVKQRSHSARNRAMILMTFWGGFRVGEVAALQYCDVFDDAGAVKPEIRLDAAVTKGKHARTVFLPEKLRAELALYQPAHPSKTAHSPLFQTQKSSERGFSANTATQLFLALYKGAGIDGASSHSGRRTFITRLASKGVTVRVLASLAGHKSIATTQRYIDVNDELKRSAVEMI
jgi:integrase/recombinase XerD